MTVEAGNQEEVDRVTELAAAERSIDRHDTVDVVDSRGVVHAEVEKTLYVVLK